MRTPIVAIISSASASLEDYYEQIQYSIDQRFHSYRPTFPVYPTSEAEYGEIETNTAYSNHACGEVLIDGYMASIDGGNTWVHIEMLRG